MGRRILRRHIWGYSVCQCPTKGTPGLNKLNMIKTEPLASEMFFFEIVDDWQWRQRHLSYKLTWAFGSGELIKWM